MSGRFEAFRRRDGEPPRIYGHRGVRGPLPENTMAAFARAADEGAFGVELDVRAAGTGEIVVLHDPDLARVTQGRDPRRVAELPWAEIAKVDVGGGERAPLLQEVLAWARPRRLRVNVEIKHDAQHRARLVRGVARAIRTVPGAPDFVMVSSFDPVILGLFGALRTGILSAFLFHEGQRARRPWTIGRALGGAALHPERTLTDREHVENARRRGVIVNVWTVNDPREARDLARLGVDGLITDAPAEIAAATR